MIGRETIDRCTRGCGLGCNVAQGCVPLVPRSAPPWADMGSPVRGCGWRSRRRSGSVLIAALVCLSIVIAIVGSMLQGTLRARRQLHAQRDLRQTEILLQAGVDRALSRLLNDADYRGETWKLPAEAIVGSRSGQVTIKASRDSLEQPWQVRVVAEYGQGHHSSIRRSHTFLVPNNPPSDQE